MQKANAGELSLDKEPFELEPLLATAIAETQAFASEHTVTVELEAEAGLWVEVDESRWQQVLANLLANAIRYSPAGGTVWLRSRRHDNDARVEVVDNGPGIASELHAHIFEKFAQGSGGPARSSRGTGLGLTISRNLVKLHGGRLDVISAPGKGSTFYVELPLLPR